MIRDLIKVANGLDSLGLKREADIVDKLIRMASGSSDPRKEREMAILEELDRLDPNRKAPKSTLSHEERAKIKHIEKHIMRINNFIAEGEFRPSLVSYDEYGLSPESVSYYYDNALSTFESGLTGHRGSHGRRLTDALTQDERDEDKRRHKEIIEGSKPRYEHMVRTEKNSPSWFRDKMRRRDIQMGGMSLDDEGEWSYEDPSFEEPSYIPSYLEGEEEED